MVQTLLQQYHQVFSDALGSPFSPAYDLWSIDQRILEHGVCAQKNAMYVMKPTFSVIASDICREYLVNYFHTYYGGITWELFRDVRSVVIRFSDHLADVLVNR